jgi:hypothetical protein
MWKLIPIQLGSKNPGSLVGADWPAKASDDSDQHEAWKRQYGDDINWGVLLGQSSGIIDVEGDTEDANRLLAELCSGVITPCYTSGKSTHYLFAYDESFEHERASVTLDGIEFRFGQDRAQSVLPPSLHPSGVRYQWIVRPDECMPAAMPDVLRKFFREKQREREAREARSTPPRSYGDDSMLARVRRYVEASFQWDLILAEAGWTPVRNRYDAVDYHRPGKSSGSISATLNFGGSGTLRIFSSNAAPFKGNSSYDKFAFLCCLKFNDDPIEAARALAPHVIAGNDFDGFEIADVVDAPLPDDEPDDYDFIDQMVPQAGLLREIFNYYYSIALRPHPVFGLATAVALTSTIFGRRICSHTNLRTNDYHVIMAPTAGGKEACETVIDRILYAAIGGPGPLIPADVQSGNGLLAAISERKTALWVADEFGKFLEAALKDRGGNAFLAQVTTLMLKMYSKAGSLYTGAAHAGGAKNAILEPHLCVLGLTTSGVFDSISGQQLRDGLFGRMAFWPIQERPRARMGLDLNQMVPESLSDRVRSWLEWTPEEFETARPLPKMLVPTPEALRRLQDHVESIDTKMDREFETRAAIWGRVNARAMKLAMVHRASRLDRDPGTISDWSGIRLELEDVDWGIRLANWLARTACGLVKENVQDHGVGKVTQKVLKIISDSGEISRQQLLASLKSVSAGEVSAAAKFLEDKGMISIEPVKKGRGRPSHIYRSVKK